MPESPSRGTVGSSINGSSLSLGYGTVQKDYQQKFLQFQGDLSSVESDRNQLEKLLKSSNVNPAKKFIRQADWAPNHVMRAQLWIQLAKRLTTDADWIQSVKLYNETLPEVYRSFEGSRRSIPFPTFADPSMTQTYHLNEEGRFRCQKILTMIEANQPQVTYAPLLYPLTALFLHFVEDDAEVFACMDALLRPRKVARKFMGDTQHAYKSAWHTMAELVRRRMKGIYNVILQSSSGEKAEDFFASWLKWIFVDLPFEIVIRVVDCYLYEGMKVLFRTGLALVKLFHRSLGPVNSSANLSQSISRFCQEFRKHSTCTELLKIGFSFSRLSQDDIIRMIQDYEATVSCATTKISPGSVKGYPTAGGDHERRSISVPLPFIPQEVLDRSGILNEDQLYTLWHWLPMRHRIAHPSLLHTTEEHGISLISFFQQVNGHEPTLLVIKTKKEIFGAFCSHSWENRYNGDRSLSYFGTGESFLFTLSPVKKLYQWIGLGKDNPPSSSSSLFMAGDSSSIIIGGGGGFGIRFESTLSRGCSEVCSTFANPPLCENESVQGSR